MARCRLAQAATCSSDQAATASASLRNMPSPAQGASTSTASKTGPVRETSFSGSMAVTTAFFAPMRSRLPRSTLARLGTISLENSTPSGTRAASWADLPPGAAHRSSTAMDGLRSKRLTGIWALSSWT